MNEEIQEHAMFEKGPAWKALFRMAFPTILSQIILVIYNMADTYFVGLRQNPAAVAAVSLCLPIYTMLTALANLCGIGGSSLMARFLGAQNEKSARKTFALSFWMAALLALIYCMLMLVFGKTILSLIGDDASDAEFCCQFCLWAIVIGGIPTILSMALAQLIRSLGHPAISSWGIIIGAVCNMILDPICIFILLPDGLEVMGAGIATAASNLISCLIFLVYTIKQYPGWLIPEKGKWLTYSKQILSAGLPSFCLVALAMLSNCFLNRMISALGVQAEAGLGIDRKIDQFAYAMVQGITQGMLPVAAYLYGAGNEKRLHRIVLLAAMWAETLALFCMCTSLLFGKNIIGFFIGEAKTIDYGAYFLKTLCLCLPIYSLTFVIIAWLQAIGKEKQAFLLSILHKGTLDIVLLFVINALFGAKELMWASFVSESVALLTGICMVIHQSPVHHFKGISGKPKWKKPSAETILSLVNPECEPEKIRLLTYSHKAKK